MLNLFAIAIIGGLVSIKSDLTSIKEELPLYKYRLELLEAAKKESEKKDSEHDRELARLNIILPDRISLKKDKQESHYD